MRMKPRHQEQWALAAFAVLLVVTYQIWPELDLAVSAVFFDGTGFLGNQWTWSRTLSQTSPMIGTALMLLTLFLAVLPLFPQNWGALRLKPWMQRRVIASLLVVILGVGLLVHVGLKDNVGRPRPAEVQVFGGPKVYQPPLHVSSECSRNCSFVSGHAAAGFALIGLGLFGSRRTRIRWWAIGTAVGAVIGLARIVQGRHFFGDILFCMLALWLVCVVLRELWLRQRLMRLSAKRRRAAQRVPA